jgi:NDP-sugar pyrophosphorylase family protein
MKLMLLAAGHGERMLPLTRTVPKPAIPVLGRPIAIQILHRLATLGVDRAVVNLHHLPDRLRSLLGEGKDLGLQRIDYSLEEEILGTAGGIGRAADLLRGSKTILVHNSDFLSDIDLSAVIAAHLASGCPVTLVLTGARPGYTPVEVDDEGRVVSIGGRPEPASGAGSGSFMFTGCQILDEEILDRIPSDRPSDIIRDIHIDLIGDRKVASYVHGGFWWEFGSPRDYLEGSIRLLDMPGKDLARVARTDPVDTIGDAKVALGAGADFHNGVSLHGRVALGLASLVAEGSEVEDSVIMPEAWVGPGCRIRRAIIAPGVELPAEFEVEDAMVCARTGPDPETLSGVETVGGLLVRRLDG